MAELKKIESQCANCHLCNKDLHYRVTKPEPQETKDHVKVLLERLKKVEEEKSQLVLENETQRQQYEKCLDDIANQVVQALLSQKTLREECVKLRKRVLDLEHHNHKLQHIFQTQIKISSDSVLQGNHTDAASGSLNSLTNNAQMSGGGEGAIGENTATPFSEYSLDSLHSMCSAHSGPLDEDDSGRDLGKAAPSSPPPWVRLSPSSSSGSSGRPPPGSMLSPNAQNPLSPAFDADEASNMIHNVQQLRIRFLKGTHHVNNHGGSKIETEFPATNDSPKMKHVAIGNRHSINHLAGGGEDYALQNDPNPRMRPPRCSDSTSPGKELLNLRDSFHERYTLMEDGLPSIQNHLFSESDTDSDIQDHKGNPLNNMSGSNVSLNDILERGLDDVPTPGDDTFSMDNFRLESEGEEKEEINNIYIQQNSIEKSCSLNSDPLIGSHNNNCEKCCSASQTSPEPCCECGMIDALQGGKEEAVQRPTSLELVTDYVNCYSSEDEESIPQQDKQPNHQQHPFRLRHSVLTDPKTYKTSLSSSSFSTSSSSTSVLATSSKYNSSITTISTSIATSTSTCMSSTVISATHYTTDSGQDLQTSSGTSTHTPRRDCTQDSGIVLVDHQLSCKEEDIAIDDTECPDHRGHTDSASPDSAMQHSFSSSSSSSDPVIQLPQSEKTIKDDGYSSNSTPSVTSSDSKLSTLRLQPKQIITEEISGVSPIYPKVPYVNPAARVSPGHYQPLYSIARSPPDAHSETCVFRPVFFHHRPQYRRMCSARSIPSTNSTHQQTDNPTFKLFRTLSDSALHRHRFRYTERIVHNIYQSLRALFRARQLLRRSPKSPKQQIVDHPECKLQMRHSKKNCVPTNQNGVVGYVLYSGVRTLGEGSEYGYKSRDDMRPDGKLSSTDIIDQSHPSSLQWSSDEESPPPLPPYSITTMPTRLPTAALKTPTSPPSVSKNSSTSLPPRLPPRSPRLNVRRQPMPVPQQTGPPKRNVKSNSCVNTPLFHIKPKPKPAVLTNGSIPMKPVMYNQGSDDNPYESQEAIEESVQLLNTVGLADGIVELEKEYINMQQNHFQKNKKIVKTSRSLLISDLEDPGYFDADSKTAFSDNEDQEDFSEQIENLSKTVDDLQKSLSSINDIDDVPQSNKSSPTRSRIPRSPAKQRRNVKKYRRTNQPRITYQVDPFSDSTASDSDRDEDCTGSEKQERSGFLDSLVMLSSSSDEESGFVYMSAQQHGSWKHTQTDCPSPCCVGNSPCCENQACYCSHSDDSAHPEELHEVNEYEHSEEENAAQNSYIIENSSDQLAKISKNESTSTDPRDMMRFLRLHPPKNPRVSQLREECRTDTVSSSSAGVSVSSSSYVVSNNVNLSTCSSFDSSGSVIGVDGISLSDSCCQSFHSSTASVQHL